MGSADSFNPFLELKVSPGNAQTLSHLYLLHIHQVFPCKFWALTVCGVLPRLDASYAVPVRQASVLPQASFRHPLASLPLPLANASPYRAHRGLTPPNVCALPGAHKKKSRHRAGFYKHIENISY